MKPKVGHWYRTFYVGPTSNYYGDNKWAVGTLNQYTHFRDNNNRPSYYELNGWYLNKRFKQVNGLEVKVVKLSNIEMLFYNYK